MNAKIAVAIPCYNEEVTISKVVKDFKRVLPEASLYVFDNNSTDRSASLAREEGAIVCLVRQRGKGNVLRAILDHVKADALIIVDGDGTYAVEEAPLLLQPVLSGEVDMVVGNRLKKANSQSLAVLHRFGNKLIVKTINLIFNTAYEDILSGYRVLSRRLIETVPLLTHGFEIETELTLQALEEGLQIKEIPVTYHPRPVESRSKLRPFFDGSRIMMTMAMLLRDHHPLRVYGVISLLCLLLVGTAFVLRGTNDYFVIPWSDDFLTEVILILTPLGVIFMGIGFILSAVNTRLREIRQIMYRRKSSHD